MLHFKLAGTYQLWYLLNMDDWKPANTSVTEFDLNECSTRDYAEVFAMDPTIAKGLQEYRTEIVHIFKFDQLLKLKGFSKETLPQYVSPQFDGKANSPFQESLGLSKELPESLPKLMEAVSKKNQASGALLISRSGEVLIKYPQDSAQLDPVARRAPDFLRPIQEQMLLTNAGTGDTFVFNIDNHELLILTAGPFYLAGIQPQGSLNSSSINQWRTLALEVRRRHPPKLFINNHASVTESDIAFDCPKCVLRIVVDYHAAGYSFPCPRCKTSVTVPAKTTSTSSFYPGEAGA
jgi:hypothetical protein